MVIALIGESCTGKSTLADALKTRTNAAVYTGKDYAKLAKNESDAKKQFTDLLASNVNTGDTIVYVISEREHLAMLPEGALRVLVTAELDTIKSRFAARLGGRLPDPVAAMLERKHGMFDGERCDLHITEADSGEACDRICACIKAR